MMASSLLLNSLEVCNHSLLLSCIFSKRYNCQINEKVFSMVGFVYLKRILTWVRWPLQGEVRFPSAYDCQLKEIYKASGVTNRGEIKPGCSCDDVAMNA